MLCVVVRQYKTELVHVRALVAAPLDRAIVAAVASPDAASHVSVFFRASAHIRWKLLVLALLSRIVLLCVCVSAS